MSSANLMEAAHVRRAEALEEALRSIIMDDDLMFGVTLMEFMAILGRVMSERSRRGS